MAANVVVYAPGVGIRFTTCWWGESDFIRKLVILDDDERIVMNEKRSWRHVHISFIGVIGGWSPQSVPRRGLLKF